MEIFLFILSFLLSSSKSTGSSSGNETDFSTSRGVSSDSGGFTDVLLITSSEGMVDGVHTDSLNSGPAMSLGLIFVILVTSLKNGLV